MKPKPIKFLKEATPSQRIMAFLMAFAFAALLLWTVFELIGVFSAEREDTWSEWVWDQDFWVVSSISVLGVIAGILLIGSAWHFLEGYGRRRRIERESRD